MWRSLSEKKKVLNHSFIYKTLHALWLEELWWCHNVISLVLSQWKPKCFIIDLLTFVWILISANYYKLKWELTLIVLEQKEKKSHTTFPFFLFSINTDHLQSISFSFFLLIFLIMSEVEWAWLWGWKVMSLWIPDFEQLKKMLIIL